MYKNKNINLSVNKNININYENYVNSTKNQEINQSYLITNPNLLYKQINSFINLNVMIGTRYFIVKSVDEDNVHKVNYIYKNKLNIK